MVLMIMAMPKGWMGIKKDDGEEKKWLVDQTKYNFDLASDSLNLELRKIEEFINNVRSTYQNIFLFLLQKSLYIL